MQKNSFIHLAKNRKRYHMLKTLGMVAPFRNARFLFNHPSSIARKLFVNNVRSTAERSTPQIENLHCLPNQNFRNYHTYFSWKDEMLKGSKSYLKRLRNSGMKVRIISYFASTSGGVVLGYGFKDIIDPFVQPKLRMLQNALRITPQNESHIIALSDPNPKLVKRAALDYLSDVIKFNHTDVTIVAISGVAGSGKTELALAYARLFYERQRDRSPGTLRTVYLLQGDHSDNLETSYRDLAVELGIKHENLVINDVVALVNAELALRPNWLLIFDNVEQLSIVKPYFPTASNSGPGSVIITTRNKEFTKSVDQKIINFDLNYPKYRFSKREAAELFDVVLGPQHPDYGKNDELKGLLAQNVAFLPIAIKRAAVFLKENTIEESLDRAIRNYIEKFRKHVGSRLSSNSFLDYSDYELINKVTHFFILDKLSALDDQVIEVLLFSMSLNPEKIQNKLLFNVFNFDRSTLASKIQLLKDFFIFELFKEDVYQMHRSLSNAILEWGYNKKNTSSILKEFKFINLKNVVNVFSQHFSSNNITLKIRENNALYVPHIVYLLEASKSFKNKFFDKKDYDFIIKIANLVDSAHNYNTSVNADYMQGKTFLLIVKSWLDELILRQNKECDLDDYNQVSSNLKLMDVELLATYARLLYSFGRIYLYVKDNNIISKEVARKNIMFACKLMDIYNEYKSSMNEYGSFEAILFRRSGLLFLDLESEEPHVIKNAIKEYNLFLNDETKYFIKGKLIIPKKDDFHRMVCHDQIAKAYQRLIKLDDEPSGFNFSPKLTAPLPFFAKSQVGIDEYYIEAVSHSLNLKEEGALSIYYNLEEYTGREAIYLNTLAYTLLCQPFKNLLQDDTQRAALLKCPIKFDNCYNNLDIAKTIFQFAIKFYENDVPNIACFPLAEAYLGLAKVYFLEKEYRQAKQKAESSLKIQKQMKRSDKHLEVLAVKYLLNEIKIQQILEQQITDNPLGYSN